MKKYAELVQEAIEMLKEDDDLFVKVVNELDNWNGYADGYRAYHMDELNDFYYNCKATKLLEDLTSDFSVNDDYFYFSIYGLESTDNIVVLYRDNTYEGYLFDDIKDNYNHLDLAWIDSDFDELINSIVNYSEDDETSENVA